MAILFSAGLAMAGTKVQGNVVGNTTNPSVSAKSKFKMAGTGDYQVGLKGITDALGNPAAVTTGTTPDTEYIIIFKGDASGIAWEFNVPFNITKEGQAKVKGSAASLLGLTAAGSPIGILGVEIHEPTTPASAAACTAVLTGAIPGVFLPPGANPCATGARVGISGIITEP
jgi:hypothetical protein